MIGRLILSNDLLFDFFRKYNLLVVSILDIFRFQIVVVMKSLLEIKAHQIKLQNRYKLLIEKAYNVRQTDHALSDISEYKAIKLLNKLNRLKYLTRDGSRQRLT